jgi:hypothetical protein
VAQDRPIPGRQDRRHPAAVLGQPRVPERIHASELRVEPATGDAIRYRRAPESEIGELRGRYKPVLTSGEPGQLRIEERGCVTFVRSS